MIDRHAKKSVIEISALFFLAIVVVAVCSVAAAFFPKKTGDVKVSLEETVKKVEKNVFELKVGNTVATGFFV